MKANVAYISRMGVEIGQALNRQKQRLGHGNFSRWLRDECGLSQSTAGRLMKVARDMVHKLPNDGRFDDLGTSALELLVSDATPQEVRDRVESLLVDGQKVTVADIRKMKADEALRAP